MTMKKNKRLVLGLFSVITIALFLCAYSTAAIAGYPSKPVSVIVPFGPSGSTGTSVNQIIPYLSKYLGQKVIMVNKGGAGGRIGATEAYKAKPDGYTLLAHNLPTAILGQLVFNAKYDMNKFVQIYGWVKEPVVLAVHKDSPFKTFDDLMAAGKKEEISCAIVGFGATSHVLSASLKKAGLKHRIIPFGSGSKAVKALLGKNADFGLPAAISSKPHYDDGRIRVLAIASEEPFYSYPGIPTFKQLGYDIELSMYRGLMGPPGMDESIVKVLAAAMEKALKDPEYLEMAKKSGEPIMPMNTAKWKDVIQNSFAELNKIAPDMKADMAKNK